MLTLKQIKDAAATVFSQTENQLLLCVLLLLLLKLSGLAEMAVAHFAEEPPKMVGDVSQLDHLFGEDEL